MNHTRIGVALAVLAALVASQSAAAQQAQHGITMNEADARGQLIFQQSATTGMVLVAVRNGETLIKGYGETAPGNHRVPDASSEIRLCSITKIMTTNLLARMASEQTVSFSDSLQTYAPDPVSVPEGPGNTPITLLDLATHTSGLAREVAAYPSKTPHFTFPDRATRWAWLPEQKLIAPPGSAALYSNVGYDLLGDSLARAAHMPFAQLLHDRLLAPLNMWDTTLVPSLSQCARLLQPIHDEGPCTDTQASGPSGGVYSTATDIVKLLGYLLQSPGSSQLPPRALDIFLKPTQLRTMQGLNHAGDPTGIGLGWIQLGDPQTNSVLLEKTGGGAGFTTYIAIMPKLHTGIFVAVTDGPGHWNIDFYHECNNLLAALADVPPLPVRLRPKHVRHAAKRRGRTAHAHKT